MQSLISKWRLRSFDFCLLVILITSAQFLGAQILPSEQGSTSAQVLNLLGTNGTDTGYLSPDSAFQLAPIRNDESSISFLWQIAPQYYLYRDKIRFRLVEPHGGKIDVGMLPVGEKKVDEYFGETIVYYNQFEVPATISGISDQSPVIEVTYQGCAEGGLCYPPIIELFVLDDWLLSVNEVSRDDVLVETIGIVSAQDQVARTLAQGSLAPVILAFFGFGLLLSFTPCVLPMVPILSSMIIGQGNRVSTSRAFAMSLSYVLAMAGAYTMAGVASGVFGAGLQVFFQNRWVLICFSLIFVVLAGAMFGFYRIQLPSNWQTKLSSPNNPKSRGTLIGAATMGFLSALIVGPCVAAPLAGALLYIGQTGNALLGGLALFAMGIGMGLPLLVIGTSAGKLLPRTGAWMDEVKVLFGFVLLGVAIYLISRIVDDAVAMFLWAGLLVFSALYLLVAKRARSAPRAVTYSVQIAGFVLVFWAGLVIVGALTGADDPIRPWTHIGKAKFDGLAFERVTDLDSLVGALELARKENKFVMLDYYADWCVSCKAMERKTFRDSRVRAALAETVLLQVDVTANSSQDRLLLQQYGLYGPPAILFFDRDGRERRGYRVVGFVKPAAFAKHAREAQI